MSRNLKVRIIVGVGMLIAAVVSLYAFNGFPFKILYTLFALMAAIELFSFFTKKVTTLGMILAIIELIFLVGSIIFMTRTDLHDFWYIVLGVCGYDTLASHDHSHRFPRTRHGKARYSELFARC